MASKDQFCELLTLLKPRLWVRPCPSYEFLPPSEDNGWREVGCLENFSEAVDEQTTDEYCLGDLDPIAEVTQTRVCTWTFGIKCLSAENWALALGGGEFVASPHRPGYAELGTSDKKPEVSLYLEADNGICIDDGAGNLINPTLYYYAPRVQISSNGALDLGTAGTRRALVMGITAKVLSSPVDDEFNPKGLPKLRGSNSPSWLNLIGAGQVV